MSKVDDIKLRTLTINYSRERMILWLFISPALAFIIFANVYPIFYALYMSFFKYNMLVPGSKPTFIGLQNYIIAVFDPKVIDSFTRTLFYVGGCLIIEFIIGMGLALLITSNVRGMASIRGIFLVPLMMTPVVAGTLWRTLYNSLYGPINWFLSLFGAPVIEFLGDAKTALPSIMGVEIWQQTPVVIFILAAGIQSLPVEIYKAAAVDGASKWQIFTRITLPLLKPVFFVTLLLRVMDLFKVFDTVYVMTYGGPGKATELISMFIYKAGLKYFDIGKAAAMSWMFLVIIFVISLPFLRRIQRTEA
ncbi:MAG: sugar ABC transporter permease [Actinobacteria bacterium]|nr:sugar ABC transporter permease [Actinomycetota bacterium]